MHYSVAVITKNVKEIENALQPYKETVVKPYIILTKQDLIKKGRQEYLTAIKERNLLLSGNENIETSFCKEYLIYRLPKELEKIDISSDEDIYKEMIKMYVPELIDEDGNITSRTNPNAKWDRYDIGGRWSGLLKLNNGECVNSATLKDISFQYNKKEFQKSLRFWDLYIEKGYEQLTKEELKEIGFVFYNKEYYLQRYKTKKNFAEMESTFHTEFVLDSNGNWLNPQSIEEYINIINKENPNNVITIVDCHYSGD